MDGSQYWPQTIEGRVLWVFLALYAVGVFGYMTAALATFFISRDAEVVMVLLVGMNAQPRLQIDQSHLDRRNPSS